MNQKELIQQVTRIFDTAIYAIRDETEGANSAIAGRMVSRFRENQVALALDHPRIHSPSITGFYLHEIPYHGRKIYHPAVVVNVDKNAFSEISDDPS